MSLCDNKLFSQCSCAASLLLSKVLISAALTELTCELSVVLNSCLLLCQQSNIGLKSNYCNGTAVFSGFAHTQFNSLHFIHSQWGSQKVYVAEQTHTSH